MSTSDPGRLDELLLSLAHAWRVSAASGHGEPVVFWRGDLGAHRAWPAEVEAMTRAEAEELVKRDIARAAHPASEVMMVSPTRRALDATLTLDTDGGATRAPANR
ncbi:unannotated protein [freshwater metagenome]|uniref:Unannotated protein n=1 Tax=freshwater metagenome TaxID=449393 RepID=A0A6J7FAP5_9ZZZZ|nr:hypothetical protein [Actinomycetota bacterium]